MAETVETDVKKQVLYGLRQRLYLPCFAVIFFHSNVMLHNIHSQVLSEAEAVVWNTRIPSDIAVLQYLHERFGWMIGRDHVRPTPAALQRKLRFLEWIQTQYVSFADSVLVSMFHCIGEPMGLPPRLSAVFSSTTQDCDIFAPNLFPYQTPHGTHHYVQWYLLVNTTLAELTDERISADISRNIGVLELGHDISERQIFEFGWYDNPKPTIADPRIHHVQVFWHYCTHPRSD